MADLRRETRDAVREGAILSASHVWPLIDDVHAEQASGSIDSVLDVGTGEGHWLDVAAEYLPSAQLYGVDLPSVIGVESAERGFWDAEREQTLPMRDADGPRPGPARRRSSSVEQWDLALCLEMAEHVTPAGGVWLVRELTRVAKIVVWSAAIPGQGGDGHVNEQWPAHWHEQFDAHGWMLTDPFRGTLWGDPGVEPWYQQNLLLARPRRAWGDPLYPGAPRAIVHPAVFDQQRALAAYWAERYDRLLADAGGTSSP